MRIGLDLDGVCINFGTTFMEFLNRKLRRSYTEEQITDYKWYDCLPDLTEEEFYSTLNMFDKEGGWSRCRFFPGVPEALMKRVSKGDTLHVITARSGNGPSAAGAAFINAGIPIMDLRSKKRNTKKDMLAIELKIDVHLEDRPKECEAVAKVGIPVILISQRGNLNWSPPSCLPIIRSASASEALNQLDSIVSSVKKRST